jgi:UDP-glucose 4-epimerase
VPERAASNAKSLVTGGAGFIGSHVVDALVADGREVVVVDDLSSGDERRVHPAAAFHRLDITDSRLLDEVADGVRPDTIFHLGAQAAVTVSVKDPARDCAVNVQGTLNVLRCAERHDASVVFTSTGGALYGNDAPIPTPETRIPAPLAPYGASKWAAEAYVNTWSAFAGTPHAVCRLGNVYGPRQSPHGEAGVVSIFSRALFDDRPPRMFGYGRPTRDYVHVDDVVRGLLAASGTRGTYNIATGVETDVATVWEVLRDVANKDMSPIPEALRAGELERSCLDPSHAEQVLGWRALVGLQDGLFATYWALAEEFERGSPW